VDGIVPRNDDPIVREGCLHKVKVFFDLLSGIARKAQAIDLGAQRLVALNQRPKKLAPPLHRKHPVLEESDSNFIRCAANQQSHILPFLLRIST
jgi:hypothetical protein